MKNYVSLTAFYEENPERKSSGEADYGVWWTEPGQPWRQWRVSYIQKTGEVYAFQLTGGKVQLLGRVPPDDERIYYRTLNRILEGWADIIHEPGSLNWVRERMQSPVRT